MEYCALSSSTTKGINRSRKRCHWLDRITINRKIGAIDLYILCLSNWKLELCRACVDSGDSEAQFWNLGASAVVQEWTRKIIIRCCYYSFRLVFENILLERIQISSRAINTKIKDLGCLNQGKNIEWPTRILNQASMPRFLLDFFSSWVLSSVLSLLPLPSPVPSESGTPWSRIPSSSHIKSRLLSGKWANCAKPI